MKVGISVSIDVTSIDKARLVNHTNGKVYLNMTTFVDTENKDKYDNNGFISESVSADERKAGVQGTILGNCKVFWADHTSNEQRGEQYAEGIAQAKQAAEPDPFHDDIPF